MAVDLGASRIRIHVRDEGLVVDEPSLAAVDTRTGDIVAVGSVAARMLGRVPGHIRVERPLASGTVADVDLAQQMLRHMVSRHVLPLRRRKRGVRAVVGVPYGSGPLTRKAAVEALSALGLRRVELVASPVAAAVGCGVETDQAEPVMLVDCGATTTQIAVVAFGDVIAGTVVPVGGDAIERAITEHVLARHGLELTSGGARDICLRLGGADTFPVTGKDVRSGWARNAAVDTSALRTVIGVSLVPVLDGIGAVLRGLSADLVVDLAARGLTMVGGAADIPGIDATIRAATAMPVRVQPDPRGRVVDGLARLIDSKPPKRPVEKAAPSENPAEHSPVAEIEDFASVA
ncbi:rod shape-determining protein [Yinghuangia sp. ASG 101]|uniref:rod shape-determining protein n=1 Tax=Yinghuangia sp. ASG 101 TaxID=2896848 RepID=UPI001E45B0E2|nr:rod shape-determining protein [Yinghuangia sp. ASG 101]UGQ10614.1 rod shape-determining protein [Yinghuangia sp. ASG 101]